MTQSVKSTSVDAKQIRGGNPNSRKRSLSDSEQQRFKNSFNKPKDDVQEDAIKSKEDPKESKDPKNMLAGDRILQGLGRHQRDGLEVKVTNTKEAIQVIEDIAHKVASAIMVSEAKNGTKEVLLTLSTKGLEGTSVHISKRNGALDIRFQVVSPDAMNFIDQRKKELLAALKKRGETNIKLEIRSQPSGPSSTPGTHTTFTKGGIK